MHCRVCPAYPFVESLGDPDHPLFGEAMSRIDELRKRCIACHLKASKHDTHLGPDRDSGKLHGEISFHDANFSTGTERSEFTDDATAALCHTPGVFKVDASYQAGRRRDTSQGCTIELDPDSEDRLRQALSIVAEKVEVADAVTLISLLKREPIMAIWRRAMKTADRYSFIEGVRRSLYALASANECVKFSETAIRAANELVDSLCKTVTALDAPILLGLLKGMSVAEIGRAAGLKNRATAHARLKSLLARVPKFESLHVTAVK